MVGQARVGQCVHAAVWLVLFAAGARSLLAEVVYVF